MCRDWGYGITVTLVYRETDWVVTAVEPGDRRDCHYGLAVDYGSTTIVMQLVDMNSGAFTAHSDLELAITIGIFPDLEREKYTCIGNTSLEGARILLLDRSRLREARELAESIYCVQFASIPDFLIRMQGAKFIPHTDLNRYPSVKNSLPPV